MSNSASSPAPAIRCKAAICRSAKAELQLEEVVVAPPRPWEVRVKMVCASLCHTDLTFWAMEDYPSVFPRIYGHEGYGVVESVGADVLDVAAGEAVVVTFCAQCDDCDDCRSDASNICSKYPVGVGLSPDGTTPFTSAATGEPIHNFMSVSSLAEYTVVNAAQVAKLDPAVPPHVATLLSCGVPTGIGGACKVAEVKEGSTVVVIGLGAVGLGVAEGARSRGAARIIGVDINPDKFDIGKKFGITDFVDAGAGRAISEVVAEMTAGGGADYCFECVGSPALMAEAFKSSRSGWGKTVVLGFSLGGAVEIPSFDLLKGRSVAGAYFGGLKTKTDIAVIANRYLKKELQLEEFVTHELRLEDIAQAFGILKEGRCIKCVIWMGK